jgi:hypothetical protein
VQGKAYFQTILVRQMMQTSKKKISQNAIS